MSLSDFRIVSGGQTGVDRAALMAALDHGVSCGGWCPKGRRAEDGVLASHYPLKETPSEAYEQRTLWNVRDSDATLILAMDQRLSGGTQCTREIAEALGKPCLVVILNQHASFTLVSDWLERHRVRVLNVAGPRESAVPGIERKARVFLTNLFRYLHEAKNT